MQIAQSEGNVIKGYSTNRIDSRNSSLHMTDSTNLPNRADTTNLPIDQGYNTNKTDRQINKIGQIAQIATNNK